MSEKVARDKEIYADREKGLSYRKIALRHGVSAERVRQICKRIDEDAQSTDPIYNLIRRTNLSSAHINGRVYNILRRNGIDTYDQLMRLSDADVIGFINAGVNTVNLVMQMQKILRDGDN